MKRVAFLGQGKIALRCLPVLFSKEFEGALKTVLVACDGAVAEECARQGVRERIDSAARNEQTLLAALRANKVDTLLSVQHPWILSSDVIDCVNGRAFNLHNARLPDYKGYNTISHAILNGDSSYATTIHWIVPRVDAGDVAYESEFAIAADDTAYSVYHQSLDHAALNFELLLKDLASDAQIPRRPLRGEGKFYARTAIADLKEIRTPDDATEVDRKARAFYFPPFEPAFIRSGPRKYYVVPFPYGSR